MLMPLVRVVCMYLYSLKSTGKRKSMKKCKGEKTVGWMDGLKVL